MVNVTSKEIRGVIAKSKQNGCGFIRKEMSTASPKNSRMSNLSLKSLSIMMCCLAEGTLVRMGNGESKPIRDIKIGHKVWNPLTNSECVVENVYRGLEDRNVHIITTENREVRASDGHPFHTPYRGTVVARNLRNGDEILTENGKEKITNIRVVNDHTYVYNLQLAGDCRNDRHFLANGFVSGDFYVQNSCF